MSFNKGLKSQAGFSLVELMVVVAIIGILAAMSVGQIGKQVAKARQSEVKSNLANLYTAMKTYQGEYGQYYGLFQAIGYSVEGQVRYNVGFNAAGTKPVADTRTYASTIINFATLCLGSGGSAAAGTNSCTLVATNGTAAQNPTATAVLNGTQTSFIAEGAAAIYNTTQDVWQINEVKNLTNSTIGIP